MRHILFVVSFLFITVSSIAQSTDSADFKPLTKGSKIIKTTREPGTGNTGKFTLPIPEKYFYALATFGGSFRIVQIPETNDPAVRKFYSSQLYGPELSANVGYHFKKRLNAGINMQYFFRKTALENAYVTEIASNGDTLTRVGTVTDNTRSFNIGPSFGIKLVKKYSPRAFGFNVSIGYASYTEDMHLYYRYRLTSSNIYALLSANYETNLLSRTSLFVSATVINSSFFILKLKNLDTGEVITIDPQNTADAQGISMMRISLGVGVKFKMKKVKPIKQL